MLKLSIGILSWGAHPTLLNTLESYRQNGLLDKAAHRFIFFQEKSLEDIRIAREYGFEAHGAKENLGIAGGYRAMLGHVTQPYYLFLENDWKYADEVHNPYQLEEGVDLLGDHYGDVIRYRSRRAPGNPLWTAQFQGNELSRPEHLLDSAYWLTDPSLNFPNHIHKVLYDNCGEWFATSAKYANWTNNPHMVRTDWARTVLLPHLGERDIERDMQGWWQNQHYTVLQGEGLFTHWRL